MATTLALSSDESYGIAKLADGRQVVFGVDLGTLLLVLQPGVPGCEVCLASHGCELVEQFEEVLERPGTYRHMTADEQGIWEQAAALVRPCDTLLVGKPTTAKHRK